MCEWLAHNRGQRLNRAVGAVHASPGTRTACPTPRMLVGGTQHHPLSAADEQINHGKQNTGPQRRWERSEGMILEQYPLSGVDRGAVCGWYVPCTSIDNTRVGPTV